jgi:hypothetical protein
MDRVRPLVALRVLAASVVLGCVIVTPEPHVPSDLGARLARCYLDDGACGDESSPARPAITRDSLGGYYYGGCRGMILASLLRPGRCHVLWQPRRIPLEDAQD